MTKRSRKIASGRANVVRRSSLNASPVLARDPLSVNYAAYSRSVRTTVLVGTALSASLLLAMVVDSGPANAAFICTPAPNAPPATYNVNQPNGIYCTTTEDLTVVTTNGVNVGPNGASGGDGSGIQLNATNIFVTNSGISIGVTTGNGNIGSSFPGVTLSGIEVTLHDNYNGGLAITDTITVSNASQIGDATNRTHNGISVYGEISNPIFPSAVIHLYGLVTNTAPIFDSTSAGSTISGVNVINGSNHYGIGGVLKAQSNYGDPIVRFTVNNSAPISTAGTAIGGFTFAASGLGPSTATTTLTNTAAGVLTQVAGPAGDGIRGYAGAFVGGGKYTPSTALAGVYVTNAGPIGTVANPFIQGIRTDAKASASQKYNAGTAIANSQVTNSGALFSTGNTIESHANAYALATGGILGGNSTGGTAIATTVIVNNTGGALSSSGGMGIDGTSLANASAGSKYHSFGGNATATTTITNSAPIRSHDDGINGAAHAYANAGGKYTASPQFATAGTAIAGVVITNNTGGTISSSNGRGVDGYTFAQANAFGAPSTGGRAIYTAIGGHATATTTVTNFDAVTSFDAGLHGRAAAQANGLASYSAPGAGTIPGGLGVGGTAIAGVVITNNTGGAISSSNGYGIEGFSYSQANGSAFQGIGGHATSTTTITNFAAVTSSDPSPSSSAILGVANASATGYGSSAGPAGTVPAGSGTGGAAVAGVVITNNTGGTIKSTNGYGISGRSITKAYGGNPSGTPAYNATGGTATATTSITNAAAVNSNNDSIFGYAGAFAKAAGVTTKTGTFPGGFATGGTAVAGVVITNNTGGTISSTNGEGIDGFAKGRADASGFTAFGGQATANVTTTDYELCGHHELEGQPARPGEGLCQWLWVVVARRQGRWRHRACWCCDHQ